MSEKTENMYQRGKIYSIFAPGAEEGDMYIGSTTLKTLAQRMAQHRAHYKAYKKGTFRWLSVFDLFDKYGVNDCRICLIELWPCTSKDELSARERYHIEDNQCVNKNRPKITPEEHKQKIKEWKREHPNTAKHYVKKCLLLKKMGTFMKGIEAEKPNITPGDLEAVDKYNQGRKEDALAVVRRMFEFPEMEPEPAPEPKEEPKPVKEIPDWLIDASGKKVYHVVDGFGWKWTIPDAIKAGLLVPNPKKV